MCSCFIHQRSMSVLFHISWFHICLVSYQSRFISVSFHISLVSIFAFTCTVLIDIDVLLRCLSFKHSLTIFQVESLIWPDPSLAPRRLVLCRIDHVDVPRSFEVEVDMFQAISLYGRKNRDALVDKFAANLPERQRYKSGYVLCQTGSSADSVRSDVPLALHLDGDQLMLAFQVVDLLLQDLRFHCIPPGDLADCEICAVFTKTAEEKWMVNVLDSKVFVMVNEEHVTSKQLKVGDQVSFCIRADLELSDSVIPLFSLILLPADQFYRQYVTSVSLLSCTSNLVEGTKELSFGIGENGSTAPEDAPKDFTIVSLCAPVLKILLEDDSSGSTEELLHLYLEDVKASVISDSDARQISTSVLKMQLDNQHDSSTSLPVVMCINADDGGGAALNIAIVEKLGQVGIERFYQHVRLEFGDSYLFVEDKMVVRIGEFVNRFLAARDDKDVRRGADASEGISEEIMVLRSRFMDGHCEEEAAPTVFSNNIVFLEDFRMKPLNIHLTLLFSGDSKSSATVRKFAGAIVEVRSTLAAPTPPHASPDPPVPAVPPPPPAPPSP